MSLLILCALNYICDYVFVHVPAKCVCVQICVEDFLYLCFSIFICYFSENLLNVYILCFGIFMYKYIYLQQGYMKGDLECK